MMINKVVNKIKKYYKSFSNPYVGEIICLHRVTDNRSIFTSNRALEITPGFLENIILSYKKKRYSFANIDSLFSTSLHSSSKRVNFSFDDGFEDVYSNAFPIFKKYGVPFTIFLTADFPEGSANIWWYRLEGGRNIQEFERDINAIHAGEEDPAVLFDRSFATSGNFSNHPPTLSWWQISEMIDSGLCTIGCHGMSHANLCKIGREQLKKEVIESRQKIESRLDIHIKHFSYPYSAFNQEVIETVKSAGYTSATIGYGGACRKKNRYCANRIFVTQP